MNVETKKLINNVLGDINFNNDGLFLYFEKNIKGKVTQEQIKKIHKDFILEFIKNIGFDPTIFKIKSKDAKYYLVRVWSPEEIILHFNKSVYDYRPMYKIIDAAVLVDLYSEMSMNELSKKINVEYSRLVKHFKKNHIIIRNITASITKDVLNKRKQSMKEKYGYENPSSVPEFQEKRKKTNLEKYGEKYYFGSDDYWSKTFKTNLEKYGVEYPMQNIDIFTKSMKNSYRTIEYVIDDVEYELQGYEPIVLQALLEYFSHDEIITKSEKMPKIMYNYNKVMRRYIPDFYIPSLGLIIEVKSNYTYKLDLKKNLAKKDACIKLGLDFEFIILERKEILKDDRRIGNIGNRRSNKFL